MTNRFSIILVKTLSAAKYKAYVVITIVNASDVVAAVLAATALGTAKAFLFLKATMTPRAAVKANAASNATCTSISTT